VGVKGRPHKNNNKDENEISQESKRKNQVPEQVNDGNVQYIFATFHGLFTFTWALLWWLLLLSMLLPLAAAVLSPP
jgi:hypothetical protein